MKVRKPNAVKIVNSPIMRGIKIAATKAITAANHKRFNNATRLVLFQLAHGPIASKKRTGTMIGTKTALK